MSDDATHDVYPKLIALNESQANPSTVFLFAHGIDPRASVANTQPQRYITCGAINSTCYTFSFHDRIGTLNFGQDHDNALLYNAYQEVQHKHPQANIVLIGISRGASAIINTLATYKELDITKLKAVILESPYMSVDSLLEHIAKSYLSYVPYATSMLHTLINVFPLYNTHGLQTIDALPHFPQQVPVFIGYSMADKTVAPGDAQVAVKLLRAQGNLVTEYAATHGRHSTLATQHDYCNAVRLFLANIFSHDKK